MTSFQSRSPYNIYGYCALHPRVRNGNPQDTSDIIGQRERANLVVSTPIFSLYNYYYFGRWTLRNTQLLILRTLVQFYAPSHGERARRRQRLASETSETVRFACLDVRRVIEASAKFFCHVSSLPLGKNALHLPCSM